MGSEACGSVEVHGGKCFGVQNAECEILLEFAVANDFVFGNSPFQTIPIAVSENVKLFDIMVSPILNYCSEIWVFHRAADIEIIISIKWLKKKKFMYKLIVNVFMENVVRYSS